MNYKKLRLNRAWVKFAEKRFESSLYQDADVWEALLEAAFLYDFIGE